MRILLCLCLYVITNILAFGAVDYEDVSIDGIWYRVYFSNAVVTNRLKNAAVAEGLEDENKTKVVIPDEIEYKGKTYRVKRIGSLNNNINFQNKLSILEVNIGKNVYEIGAGAFKGCSNLKKVNLEETNVEKIYNEVFMDCSSLREITFPVSCTIILDAIFRGCTSLKTVTIHSPITNLPYFADDELNEGELFKDCISLEHINFPSTIENLGNRLFCNCKSLKTFEIPELMTGISHGLFQGCSSLEEIKIHDGVKKVGVDAFKGCESLRRLNLPNSIESVGKASFEGCTSLLSINLNNITNLPDNIFKDCVSLDKIEIPSGVSSIGANAFLNCSSLKNVHLPERLTMLGAQAFNGCNSLTEITLPSGITTINDYLFNECQDLENIIILGKVTQVGKFAFQNCKLLKEIDLSDEVTQIGESAFRNCSSLKGISIPDKVTKIGEYAFSGAAIEVFTSPSRLDWILENTFKDCEYLREIELNEGLKGIGNMAFKGCSRLMDFSFPSTLQYIMTSAFEDCSLITKVTLPQNCLFVKERAFYNCESLNTLVIEGNRVCLGDEAFINCTDLNTIIVLSKTMAPTLQSDNVFKDYDANLYFREKEKSIFKNNAKWGAFFETKTLEICRYKSAFGEDKKGAYPGYKGCTADGVSELLFTYESPFDSENLKLQIYRNTELLGSNFKLAEEKIETAINIDAEHGLVGNKRGFIFTAPVKFEGVLSSYDMRIKASVMPTYNEIYDCCLECSKDYCADFEIWRPAVLLIHGLFSNRSALEPLQKYLTGTGMYRTNYHVYCAGYEKYNSSSFEENTLINNVVEKNLLELHNGLLGNGIVSSRYDLIGHSMGGILARLYSGKGSKERNTVRSIITLNTPHSGSQWGDLCRDIAINADIQTLNGILSMLFDKAKETLQKSFPPAVSDLSVSSSAIKNYLNNNVNFPSNFCKGIPVHSVTTYINDMSSESEYLEAVYTTIGLCQLFKKSVSFWEIFTDFELTGFYFPTTPFEVNQLLASQPGQSELSDFVVPFRSQTGGLMQENVGIFNERLISKKDGFAPASHFSSYAWPTVQKHIAECLEAGPTSNYFTTDGFNPYELFYVWPMTKSQKERNNAKAIEQSELSKNILKVSPTSTLKIANVEINESSLNCSIIQDLDIKKNAIVGFSKGDYSFFDGGKDSYSFNLPHNIDDEVTIYAFGLNGDKELVIDSVQIHVENIIEPQNIKINFQEDTVYLPQGMNLSISATAVWDENDMEYISPELSCDNSCVKIKGSNIIGFEPGKCIVRAIYANKVDSCNVVVLPNTEGFDENLWMSDIETISLTPDYLVLSVGDSYKLDITATPTPAKLPIFKWYSSEDTIACVDSDGQIHALSSGTCRITARETSGLMAYCSVKVVPAIVTPISVKVNPESVYLRRGERCQLICEFYPEDTSDKRLEWFSDNEEIAVVDTYGLVTKLNNGQCTIHARTLDGSGLDASCIISDEVDGLEDIYIDSPVDVYDINGIRLRQGCRISDLGNLIDGIYIIIGDGISYKLLKNH